MSGLGRQVAAIFLTHIGAALLAAVVWLWWRPRGTAAYVGGVWVDPSGLDLSADVQGCLGLLMAALALASGLGIVATSSRPGSGWRTASFIVGAGAGCLVVWGFGGLAGQGFHAFPNGATSMVPLAVTVPGLLLLWPAGAALVGVLGTAIRGLFDGERGPA